MAVYEDFGGEAAAHTHGHVQVVRELWSAQPLRPYTVILKGDTAAGTRMLAVLYDVLCHVRRKWDMEAEEPGEPETLLFVNERDIVSDAEVDLPEGDPWRTGMLGIRVYSGIQGEEEGEEDEPVKE